MTDAFTALWEKYRAEHDAELAEPYSILAITSITYLTAAPTRIDGVPGRWSTGAEGIRVELQAGEELLDTGAVTRGPAVIGPFVPSPLTTFVAGDIRIEAFREQGHDIVRPRDPAHLPRVRFRGTPAYRPDRSWVIDAAWRPLEEAVRVDSFAPELGKDVVSPGCATFTIGGVTVTLRATPVPGRPDEIVFLFRDRTSGVTTPAAVRELVVKKPAAAGPLTLDFTRTRNKNCAYSDFAICPLPPAGNTIPVAVEAGERTPYEREPGNGVLIQAEDLHRELGAKTPPAVLDVRWRLDRPDGRPEYLEQHLPGAVYVDLDHELAAHGAPPSEGRHPLPSWDALEESARRWGVQEGQSVVVYDNLKGLSAARAWWLLRAGGIRDVRILDGGIRSWTDAGLPTESGAVTPERGDVVLGGGELPVLSIDETAAFPGRGVLLDSRAGDRYRGETEPIDPRAGHIPGAKSAPTTENLGADGRFLPAEELRARFAALGIDGHTEVTAYCGSGVTASHQIAALAIAGIDAALYPGSWSQWANHPELPVATGATP